MPTGLNFWITGGRRIVVMAGRVAVEAKSCFRLSSFGRNKRGVCAGRMGPMKED